jgi:plasmid segregation protein ParM
MAIISNTNYTNTSSSPIIIGVDNGYGNMKTAHTVFPTGILHHTGEPVFKSDLLVYEGKYYTVGEGHKEFLPDKAMDEDYFLLTLAAIGKELDYRGIQNGTILLAVGLPLTWVSEQKRAFAAYLSKNRSLSFTFNGKRHLITIAGVEVYPQGFAAVAPHLKDFHGVNMMCDIGNGTMNVMYIINGKPVPSKCYTEKYGTHQCTLAIREKLMQRHHVTVDDAIIEQVLRTKEADIGEEYLTTIRAAAMEYAEGIMRRLREHEYNPAMMRLYVLGGGGCLVKNFAQYDRERVTINEDICATAKGYEALAEAKLKKNEGGIV